MKKIKDVAATDAAAEALSPKSEINPYDVIIVGWGALLLFALVMG